MIVARSASFRSSTNRGTCVFSIPFPLCPPLGYSGGQPEPVTKKARFPLETEPDGLTAKTSGYGERGRDRAGADLRTRLCLPSRGWRIADKAVAVRRPSRGGLEEGP